MTTRATRRRGAAIVGAAAFALSTLALAGPAGATGAQEFEVLEDCFGQPISRFSTIYVPANSTDWTYGTSGDDVIIGTDGPDLINGRGGNDTICGGGDEDRIFGDLGNDEIDGEGGPDIIFGNENEDRIYSGRGADTIDAGDHDDVVFGEGGDDEIWGGYGDDTLYGQDDDDIVHCGDDLDGADDDFAMGNEGYDWHTDCETWWTDDFPGPE
jgi:Ca2+-binding RTX toxin-like protein